MLKVSVYNKEGQVVGEQNLNPKVWGVKAVGGLVHEALRWQRAKGRQVLAHTKTRGEVRGGGRKPWRQKGTGRARAGTIRSPLWRGGGIVFGPLKERNFEFKMNKKAHRKAILMCLSEKPVNSALVVLDNLDIESLKTKSLVRILKNIAPVGGRKILLALARDEKELVRVGRNIPRLALISASSMNVKDLLSYPVLLTTKKGVDEIERVYGAKTEASN